MKTPSQIVWEVHGSTAVADCEPCSGRCWMCAGELVRGQRVERFSGASFTGQNKVRSPASTHVCEPCVWICSRTSPVLGRPAKEGKTFGGNFRNYSHMWDGQYLNASKGEKPLIREFLAREHSETWFAAIADSGQKHVLPWAPLNGPGLGGRVLFDETLVNVPRDQSLVTRITDLLTAGVTKDELETGRFTARAWELARGELQAFEDEFGALRNSSWFGLALWLSQRDEEKVSARIAVETAAKKEKKQRAKPTRERATSDRNSRVAPSRKGRLPRDAGGKRAQALGAAEQPAVVERADIGDTGGVVNATVPQSSNPEPQQLGLFGSS